MKRLEIKGVEFTEMTMHVGLGTFKPVEVEDLSKHKMDSEQMWIYPETVKAVNNAINTKKKVVAIGSTVLRSLESVITTERAIKSYEGWNNKFIYPPHKFQIVDALVTNFHPPQSTVMMLTSAYMDYDLMMECYKVAIKEEYRFLCYGDAMLILP